MREIKFRCWDKVLNYYINEDDMPILGDGRNKILTFGDTEMYTFGQYTGLKDKNGKEIYEGDILRCEHLETKEIETVAVKFNPGQFAVYDPNCCDICKDSDGCMAYLSDWVFFPTVWKIEVIGNIHENPELLEG